MAQWAQIIADRKASGKNVKDYCQSRGISRDAYFYWQKALREAAIDQMGVLQTIMKRSIIVTGWGLLLISSFQF